MVQTRAMAAKRKGLGGLGPDMSHHDVSRPMTDGVEGRTGRNHARGIKDFMINLNKSVHQAKQACQLCIPPDAAMSRWKIGRASALTLMYTQ